MNRRRLVVSVVITALAFAPACGDSGGGTGDETGSETGASTGAETSFTGATGTDDTGSTANTDDGTGADTATSDTGTTDDTPATDDTGGDDPDATSGTDGDDADSDIGGPDDGPGDCPNLGTTGVGSWFEVCASDAFCECGLFCKSGACMPFEGDETDCSCGDEPDDPADAGGGGGGASDVTDGADAGPTVDIDDCFEPAPNGATCNPWCQLGCADDEQCSLIDTNFACAAVGALPFGADCVEPSDCAEGLSCYGLLDEPSPTCRQMCDVTNPCPVSWECTLELSFSAGFTISFCAPVPKPCDLWSQDCKASGQCILVGSDTTCIPSTGEGEKGSTCGSSTDCLKGLLCVGTLCVEPCSYAAAPPAGATVCADLCEQYENIDPFLEIGWCL